MPSPRNKYLYGRSHFDGQNLMESGGKTHIGKKQVGGRGMKIAGLKGNGLACVTNALIN